MDTVVLVPHASRPFCDLEAPDAPREHSKPWGCIFGLACIAVIAAGLSWAHDRDKAEQAARSQDRADAIEARQLRQEMAALRARLAAASSTEKQLRRELDTRRGRP